MRQYQPVQGEYQKRIQKFLDLILSASLKTGCILQFHEVDGIKINEMPDDFAGYCAWPGLMANGASMDSFTVGDVEKGKQWDYRTIDVSRASAHEKMALIASLFSGRVKKVGGGSQ